ncbi:MAG: microcyclamide/patellamide family RiPP [Oscillatoria sp. SIO1A7]|nr:microcyclamide/patellamide family RiPP [Oscillatoria sp. SIO1A7]
MDKKNISPNPQQPVDRVPSGQLPSALAELSEEALGQAGTIIAVPNGLGKCGLCCGGWYCSSDGDDE